ncbi:MAG: hypothetical protein ACE5JK_08155 [Candidatus Omnitrophota bacterium]
MKKIVIILICFIALFAAVAGTEEGLVQVRGVIHLNTDVSSGEFPPEELVMRAKKAGVGAVFLTENLRPRWKYGAFPFRGIVKKTVEKNGLLKYGIEKYKKRVDRISKQVPGVKVFMSVEAAPFYYWTGRPYKKGDLTLHDWDLQFIIFGMEAEDYKRLPTLSNGSFSKYTWKSLFLLWPFILIIGGIISLKRKHPRFYMPDSLCWLIIVTGLVFALHNYPFKDVKYDPYHGNVGIGPYQELIDYVGSKGGMTFWSNPEAETSVDLGPIKFVSPPASDYMLKARNYTGFCCFYEGYRKVGGPGGIWDRVLDDYCRGHREKPIWAIGETAYHGTEVAIKKPIDEVQTVFLVPSNSRENILKAMKKGNMYVVRKSVKHRLQLDSFSVEYEQGRKAGMGGEFQAPGPATVRFKVDWEGEPGETVSAKLVRNGILIKEFFITEPGEFEYKDDFYEPGRKIYYRLDIRAKYPSMLFSNPIFVKFK